MRTLHAPNRRAMIEFRTLQWEIYVRSPRREKAEGQVRRIAAALGCTARVDEIERHHSVPGLWHVVFSTPLGVPDAESAVFQLLQACQRVLPLWNWRPEALQLYGDGECTFGLIGKKPAEGLEWIFCHLSAWRHDPQEPAGDS